MYRIAQIIQTLRSVVKKTAPRPESQDYVRLPSEDRTLTTET
jgi:hypothetical protein